MSGPSLTGHTPALGLGVSGWEAVGGEGFSCTMLKRPAQKAQGNRTFVTIQEEIFLMLIRKDILTEPEIIIYKVASVLHLMWNTNWVAALQTWSRDPSNQKPG